MCFRPAINKQANMNKYSFAFVTNQSLPFLLTVMVDVFLCAYVYFIVAVIMTNQTWLMSMFLSSVLKLILIFFGGTEMCADPVPLLDGLLWEGSPISSTRDFTVGMALAKVYVATISANHSPFDGASVGRHFLVSQCLICVCQS